MKILVHPQVLQDENFGILLGCYTKDQIYISKKLPKEPSDLKLLSKVLVQGNFIIGIYSNEKLDEKTLSKRLDVLNNLYEEKFPKVFLQKNLCKIYNKTFESKDFEVKEIIMKPITTNLTIEISIFTSDSNKQETIKKSIDSYKELIDSSQYVLNDSQVDVYYPTNSTFKPIKVGKFKTLSFQLHSMILSLDQNLESIKKDLKKSLQEQFDIYLVNDSFSKRCFINDNNLPLFYDYSHNNFDDIEVKIFNLSGIKLDKEYQKHFKYSGKLPQSPIKNKERKKVVDEDDLVSNSQILKVTLNKMKENVKEELPSNFELSKNQESNIKNALEDIDNVPSLSTIVLESRKEISETIETLIAPSNTTIAQKTQEKMEKFNPEKASGMNSFVIFFVITTLLGVVYFLLKK